ncbi:hypothetical protein [Rhizobium sp. S96]|uniref:hypothetical protein n=1 Tax=Rhizobium sp. S96 TaxID=3055140 RepID=UPI0025AA47E3|nr:hypothetical protein [Rhizobium sp. S96]MDM9618779.1 hypothetical protein [Rhizobium sp. S96]
MSSTLRSFFATLNRFKSQQMRNMAARSTRRQLARLPSHLIDDLDLRSLIGPRSAFR